MKAWAKITQLKTAYEIQVEITSVSMMPQIIYARYKIQEKSATDCVQ